MRRLGGWFNAGWVAALVLCACQRPSDPLEVRFAGCPEVEAGPRCVVRGDGPVALTFAVRGQGRVEARFEGEALPLVLTATAGVRRATVTVAGPGQLVVLQDGLRFELDLVEESGADPEAVAQSQAARRHLGRGEWQEALALLEASAPRHAARGTWWRAVEDLQAGAYTLTYEAHRLDEASAWLDRAEPWLVHHGLGWAFQPYYRALISLAAAEPARALGELELSRARLAAVAPEQLITVEHQRATALQLLGRHDEVRAVFAAVAAAPIEAPCERAQVLNNLAWIGLLVADGQGRPPSPDVRAVLDEAQALFRRRSCPAWYGEDQVGLHLALVAVLDRDPKAARAALEQVPEGQGMLAVRLLREELEGRIDLLQADLRGAHAAFGRGAALARQTLELDAAWRFELLEAEAYRAAGDLEAELAALERAERVLSDEMLRVPLGEGRGMFLADRTRSAERLARRALDAGRIDEAACALRRMRARALARAAQGLALEGLSRDARQNWVRALGDVRRGSAELEAQALGGWALPAGERAAFEATQAARADDVRGRLRAALGMLEGSAPPVTCAALPWPGPGEVTLAWFSLQGDPGPHRLLGLVSTASGTRAHTYEVAPQDPAEWLAPFLPELQAARRIRIVTGGPEGGAPLHTAPFLGATLGARRAVTYALDLAARTPSAPRPDLAVVISDPGRNLEGARREGAAVEQALRRAGWPIQRLEGAEATAAAVRAALPHATLLHLAGHARTGGATAWSDHLVLHNGTLGPADILASGVAPRWVVLTGCETSPLRPEEHGAGLSLAHAFLLAGAEQVLAATDEVDDAASGALGARLYAEVQSGAVDLAEAYRQAFASTATEAHAQWAPFRVWGP
ncbi:MAG: CHAT domain-containing protein [Deltaproteobacteria bacterium]|nr:CHAT domain-containing protein [Deltaproteobacteria bacterium]